MSTEEFYAFQLWYWRTLESPLDCSEIQPVHPKGNQSWIFIGKTEVEAETPILWPPDAKNWLIGKDHDAGKDWRQEKEETTEDERVGWNHWLNGLESEQALGVGDGQGSLDCCSPWAHKELDMTKLNWFVVTYGSSDGKESACNVADLGSIPGSGRSPGEGNGNPLRYSCLENSMNRPWGCKESDTSEWVTHIIAAVEN